MLSFNILFLNDLDHFFTIRYSHFFLSKIIKRTALSLNFELCLRCKVALPFLYHFQQTKHQEQQLDYFLETFFQSYDLDGIFFSFHLYLFMKALTFYILCGPFLIISCFSANVIAYCMLFKILFNQENLCSIHHDLNLFVIQSIDIIKDKSLLFIDYSKAS